MGKILAVIGTLVYFLSMFVGGLLKDSSIIGPCVCYLSLLLVVAGIVIAFRRKERGRAFSRLALPFVVVGAWMMGSLYDLLRYGDCGPVVAVGIGHIGIGLALWYLGRTVAGSGNPGV
ncbi:MAG: hypothetical protein V1809_12935 [Planctomycetota bacterium]